MKVRRTVAAVAALGAAACAIAAPSASAATHGTKHAAKEYFLISVAGDSQTVIAHGAFVGAGKDVSGDASDVLHLGGGTLKLTHPEKQSHFTDKVDPTTCFVTFAITGKYTLGHGTGKYRGLAGSGSYRVTEQGILKRTKSGTCSQTAAPTIEAGYIKASGPVSTS